MINYIIENQKLEVLWYLFSFTAISSLSAGILISMTSWKSVNLLCIPFLILIIASILNADLRKTEKT